jgi:molecular chaperone GrpE
MSEKKNKTEKEEEKITIELEEEAVENQQTAEDTFKARIAELENEIKEKDDRYLRMAAEYDNFRRRSREEKDALYVLAVSDTVNEFLPIIDTLERAVTFEDGEAVKEGLKLVVKNVEHTLSNLGVESVGNPGDIFDPNLHNAVMHIEDENYKEGEIVEVLQKGYKKDKRVIRFAMVKSAN